MITIIRNRMLGYNLLSSYTNIFHFVTTRHGGYSEGNYATFNCTPYSGDNPEAVERNQLLLKKLMPEVSSELIIPYQVHGTEIRVVDIHFSALTTCEKDSRLNGVDALITNLPYCCLCVSTADCVPVLLYDTRQKVVASIHAGWRGTVASIVEKVIKEMVKIYGSSSQDIVACIGPSISVSAFEVGEEVYHTFESNGFDMPRISFRNNETQKWHINLWEANRIQLLETGLLSENIEIAGICTYSNSKDFFSARKLGINSGRILSGIMLRDV